MSNTTNEEPSRAAAETIDGNFEIAPIESITRAEVDVQIATAHKFKRSLQEFYRRAEAMVTFDEETAASCLYRLTRFDKRSGETKVIEGESVRMAEIVASCYGNLRSAVQVIGHTPTRVSVRAVCHDLETNNLIAVEKQAKTAHSDGRPYNEDMAIMTANALVSKALRDAIFRVVPKALIKPLKEKAKLVALGTAATLKLRIDKAMTWVDSLKIDKDRVFAVLQVKGVADIGLDQLEVLTGLRTAIKEGDQSAEDAFPELEESSKPNFDHPAKRKQAEEEAAAKKRQEDAAKAAAEASKAVAAQAVTAVKESESKAKATKKKDEPKPEPAPATQAPPPVIAPEAKTDEQQLAADGLAPEIKQPEPTPPPVTAPEPAPEPAPTATVETQPSAAATEEATKAPEYAQLEAALAQEGYTFQDLINWGQNSIFPKGNTPKDWSDIPITKVQYFLRSIKGVLAAIKQSKAPKK